jgi:hypothetical protein
MSTKQEPGPFDGMARAEPDEPVFTLRAHDPLAFILVHEWVDRRRKAIRAAHEREEITEAKRELELLQCREAEELAWSMEAWRKGEIGRIAAELEVAPAKPTYSGHTKSDEELAAKARFDAIKGACQLINNAVASVTEAAQERLAAHGFINERAAILTMAERLKAVSSHIAPKRASYAVGDANPEPIRFSILSVPIVEILGTADKLKRAEVYGDADPS